MRRLPPTSDSRDPAPAGLVVRDVRGCDGWGMTPAGAMAPPPRLSSSELPDYQEVDEEHRREGMNAVPGSSQPFCGWANAASELRAQRPGQPWAALEKMPCSLGGSAPQSALQPSPVGSGGGPRSSRSRAPGSGIAPLGAARVAPRGDRIGVAQQLCELRPMTRESPQATRRVARRWPESKQNHARAASDLSPQATRHFGPSLAR
jgi:hypothetical protein